METTMQRGLNHEVAQAKARLKADAAGCAAAASGCHSPPASTAAKPDLLKDWNFRHGIFVEWFMTAPMSREAAIGGAR